MDKAMKQAAEILVSANQGASKISTEAALLFLSAYSREYFDFLLDESIVQKKPIVDLIADMPGVSYDRHDVLDMVFSSLDHVDREVKVAMARYLFKKVVRS